ncbi:C1 family peptidase [Akkermansiaceae bacterium]|nr:C1 family peptidase [Akkermansiaceae bacterium]
MRYLFVISTLGQLSFFVIGALLWAAEPEPVVVGKGGDRFEIGKLLHQDDFENLDRWVVQIEEKEGFDGPEARVVAQDATLDSLVPGRGCTIWFKEKLKTRLAISYEVICPEPKEGMKGVEVKDVNNFWLASDPGDSEKGLFDSTRYDGGFTSYNKMHVYTIIVNRKHVSDKTLAIFEQEPKTLPTWYPGVKGIDSK